MDALRNNEEKIMCPYNSSHHIRKYRMECHLTKCRKSYKESEILVECDFNACHRIPELELQYHHDTCPDRKKVEIQVITEAAPAVTPLIPMPAIQVPVDESWDDYQVPSYNPQKYCEENNILRHLDTESAAKRRDFRVTERYRINNLGSERDSIPGRPASSKEQSENRPSRKNIVVQNLPPTPRLTSSGVEATPSEISSLLDNLHLQPKKPLIQKNV